MFFCLAQCTFGAGYPPAQTDGVIQDRSRWLDGAEMRSDTPRPLVLAGNGPNRA